MSEAERQRRLRITNRLEELRARLGPLPDDEEPDDPETEPSWGPLGSLVQRSLPEQQLRQLMAQHQALLVQNRDHAPAEPESEVLEHAVAADW